MFLKIWWQLHWLKNVRSRLAYAIGVSKPVSININCFNTGVFEDEILTKVIKKVFNFRPAAIIQKLDLLNISYEPVSNYGNFGREDLNVGWTYAKQKLQNLLKVKIND